MIASILALIVIIIFDYMPIIKEKKKKEIWIYGLFLTAGYALLLVHEGGVDIPSPLIMIERLLRPVALQ